MYREHTPSPLPPPVPTVPAHFHGFVVDTDAYAGNFERELVAYMTGQIGRCNVGKETAERAIQELDSTPEGKAARIWCAMHIRQRADENHVARPASIYPTPGWFNDGHGNHHPEGTDPQYGLSGGHGYPGHYPAYQSVVAWFDAETPSAVQDVLARRAAAFLKTVDRNRGTLVIEGMGVIPVQIQNIRLVRE